MGISQITKTYYECDRCKFVDEDKYARGSAMTMKIDYSGKTYDGSYGGNSYSIFLCGRCCEDFNNWKSEISPTS